MNRWLVLCGTLAVFTGAIAPAAQAEKIECAAELPSARGGHWYYRIIDGRKCWYRGKAMVPKSSLYWAKSPAPETDHVKAERQDTGPATDGRSVGASPQGAPPAWPAPEPAEGATPPASEISFESRWLGLRSRD